MGWGTFITGQALGSARRAGYQAARDARDQERAHAAAQRQLLRESAEDAEYAYRKDAATIERTLASRPVTWTEYMRWHRAGQIKFIYLSSAYNNTTSATRRAKLRLGVDQLAAAELAVATGPITGRLDELRGEFDAASTWEQFSMLEGYASSVEDLLLELDDLAGTSDALTARLTQVRDLRSDARDQVTALKPAVPLGTKVAGLIASLTVFLIMAFVLDLLIHAVLSGEDSATPIFPGPMVLAVVCIWVWTLAGEVAGHWGMKSVGYMLGGAGLSATAFLLADVPISLLADASGTFQAAATFWALVWAAASAALWVVVAAVKGPRFTPKWGAFFSVLAATSSWASFVAATVN